MTNCGIEIFENANLYAGWLEQLPGCGIGIREIANLYANGRSRCSVAA